MEFPRESAECKKRLVIRPELHQAIVEVAKRDNAKLYVVTDEVVRLGLKQKGIVVPGVGHA